MSALKPVTRSVRSAFTGAPMSGLAGEGYMLPRSLRRPVRFLRRLVAGEVEMPRHGFAIMTGAYLSAVTLYGAALGGHLPGVVQTLASGTGFAISEIAISGNTETSEIDVMGALELDGWTALPGFSPAAARQRIASLPWVEGATVRKIYPSTLQVRLDERHPFALWQDGETVKVIERDGKVIAPYTNGRFAALPLVVGEGAEKRADMFVSGMARFPEIANRVKGYVRVGDRRWDLSLDNGVTIKLPAADPSSPAEAVTDALRQAGVAFEVETIERVPATADAPAAPVRTPAPPTR